MKFYNLLLLFLLMHASLRGQFKIETINKENLGLKTEKTIKGGYIIFPIFMNTSALEYSRNNHSFLEKDSTIYYCFKDTTYNISKYDKGVIQKGGISQEYKNLITKDSIEVYIKNVLSKSKLKIDKKEFIIDFKNRIWFFPSDSIISYIENNSLKQLSLGRKNLNFKVNKIIISNDKTIWIASSNGLYFIKDSISTFQIDKVECDKKINVHSIAQLDNENILVLYNRNELGITNGKYLKKIRIQSEILKDLYSDNYGNTWILAENELSLLYNNREILVINATNGYKNEPFENSLIDSRHNIWFLTKSTIGLISTDKKNISIVPKGVWQFKRFYESNNKIWFIGDAGSSCYDYNTGLFVHLNDKFHANSCLSENINEDLITCKDFYSNADLVDLSNSNLIYFQYNLSTTTTGVPGLMRYEEANENSALVYIKGNEMIDLKILLEGQDYRPIDVFYDSDKNLWIDTPTQLHKIFLR